MRTNSYPNNTEGLAAPPPLLLFSLVVLFILIVIGMVGAITYFTTGRLIGLVPFVLIGFGVFVLATLTAGLLFRRAMPRWVLPVLLAFWLIVIIAAGVGGVAFYQTVLPPRYQTELLTPLPFMRAFLPATPEGGIVPTVAVDDAALNADDLLGLTFTEATEQAETTPEITITTTQAAQNTGNAGIALAAANATDTPLPSVTPTPLPSATATLSVVSTLSPLPPTQTPAALVSAPVVPNSARMFGFTHIQQGWNNCGPANITMALSVYGWRESQTVAANFLKPNDEDKNVTPQEMVAFVNDSTGVRAVTRMGGDMLLIKQFIANNFPVIVQTAYFPEGYDWIGHYHTVVGYDDSAGAFYVYDSFLGSGVNGSGIAEPYGEFDSNWAAFNRTFIVLYERERETQVQQILGERATPEGAAEIALQTAQQEARANPRNMYAWFNLGSSFTRLGRYDEAARAFDRARSMGLPFRMMWYQFGPFESYFNVGRYDEVRVLVDSTLATTPYVEEIYYWQGRVFEQTGDEASARAAYQTAVRLNTRYQLAIDAVNRVS
ncbi:MAG: C39 family peptidase [bacterium]|nr:C39 family peptidase [bacterium]